MLPVFRAAAKVGAGLNLRAHDLRQRVRRALRREHDGLSGPRAEGKAVCSVRKPRRGAGERGKVRFCRAYGLIEEGGVFLRDMHAHEDIPVIRHLGKPRERDDPALIKLNRGVQRQKQREHIGKAEPAVNAPAERRGGAKLHADDAPQRFAHSAVGVLVQPRVRFERAQRGHRADGEALRRFPDRVQTETGKVDRRADGGVLHFEPEHAADHAARALLVERPGLLERSGADVFANGYHGYQFSVKNNSQKRRKAA